MSGAIGSDKIILNQITTPSNPPSGTVSIYPKSDGSIYKLSPVGDESKLLSSGDSVSTDTIRTYVYNGDTENTIPRGSAVRITNSSSGGVPYVYFAIAHKIEGQFSGISDTDIPPLSYGYIISVGKISGLNTSSFQDGSILYLSDSVNGGFISGFSGLSVNSRAIQVGYVLNSHSSTGSIYVSPENESMALSSSSLEKNILEGNAISTGVYSFSSVTITGTISPDFNGVYLADRNNFGYSRWVNPATSYSIWRFDTTWFVTLTPAPLGFYWSAPSLSGPWTAHGGATGSLLLLGPSGITKTSNTTFNISPAKGWIVRNTNYFASHPEIVHVNYPGETDLVLTENELLGTQTFLLLDEYNSITRQSTSPTPTERREKIYLGKLVHPDHVNILTANNIADFVTSPMAALRDMFTPIKLINDGVAASPNGSNISINMSQGNLFGLGINWSVDSSNPDRVTIASKTAAQFFYRTMSGGYTGLVSNIDATHYDVGGVVTSIPAGGDGSGHRSTNQRIYLFPTGTINIQYGQQTYESLALAIAGQQTEVFSRFSNVADNAILIGVLAVRRITDGTNGRNLNDSNYAVFTPASIFGESIGGVNGISTTTLQQSYDNSITPEIITDSTRGALTIRRGSSSDTDHIIEGMNNAGAVTSSIDGQGNSVANDIFISSLNRNFQTLGSDTKMSTGVPWGERGNIKCIISYNLASSQIDVSLAFTSSGPFSYYINDHKYTITTLPGSYSLSVTPAEGVWFVYISQNNVFTVTQTPWNIYDPDVLLWNFYYSSITQSIRWIGEERHTAGRDIYQHARNHAQGAIYKNGLLLSTYNGLTALGANAEQNPGRCQFQISTGSFYDEDIPNTIISDSSQATFESSVEAPSTNWNLNVNQYLGFTNIAASGTSGTTIAFPVSRFLRAGQIVTIMNGNSTTLRGTATINTSATGTVFNITYITGSGAAVGDALVVGAMIPMYYIDNVSGAVYRWRKLSSTGFYGVIHPSGLAWTRSGTTISVTSTSHGFLTGHNISIDVTSDSLAVPMGDYLVTKTGSNTFTINGLDAGGASGTLSYSSCYTSGNINTGIAVYNSQAGGFLAMTNNRYFPAFLVATNSTSEPIIAILGQGQSSNSTLSTALNESPFQFQNLVGLSALGIQEMVPFYRLAFQYLTTNAQSRAMLKDATFINVRVTTASGSVIGGGTTSLSASNVTLAPSTFIPNTNVQSAFDSLGSIFSVSGTESGTGSTATHGATAGGAKSAAFGVGASAAGDSSISIGNGASSPYLGGISIGENIATASLESVMIGRAAGSSVAWYCTGVGSNVACGAMRSIALGYYALASRVGELAVSGDNSYLYKNPWSLAHFTGQTTNATETELYLQGLSPYRCTVANNSSFRFYAEILAKQSGTANVASWTCRGIAINNGGITSVFLDSGNPTVTSTNGTVSGWAISFTADDTNDALAVKVTGADSATIKWHITIQIVEIKD